MADGNRIVIGLAGSFGSGCATLGDGLAGAGFKVISLSKVVHDIWRERNLKNHQIRGNKGKSIFPDIRRLAEKTRNDD